MEEAQRVRLHDLSQVHDSAQFLGGFGNCDRHDHVAGLSRGDEVADRANAANAGHQRGHLLNWPALAEFLEPAELGDVELRVLHLSVVTQSDRDFGMAFDAGYGIDRDSWHGSAPKRRNGDRLEIRGTAACDQFRNDAKDGVSRRWTARYEHIDLHHFMYRPENFQQLRNHFVWNLLLNGHVLDVAQIQRSRSTPKVLRIAGTLPVTAQSPRATRSLVCFTNFSDFLQVIRRADCALHQSYVDVFGKLLGIHQRRIDEICVLTDGDQSLVHVEKRHVATRAAVKPNRRQIVSLLIVVTPALASNTAGIVCASHLGH